MSQTIRIEDIHTIVAEPQLRTFINNQKPINSGSLGNVTGEGPTEDLNDNVSDTNDLLKDISNSLKQINLNGQNKGNTNGSLNTLPVLSNGGFGNAVLNPFQRGSNLLSTMAGDTTGTSTFLATLNNGTALLNTASKFAGKFGLKSLGGILGGVGTGIGAGALALKGMDAMAEQTAKVLPTTDSMYSEFYDYRNEGSKNREVSKGITPVFKVDAQLKEREKLVENNRNTGLTNTDFINLMRSFSTVGYKSDVDEYGNKIEGGKSAMEKAADVAGKTAKMAYGIGMDASDMARYTKYIERYGEGDSENVINTTFKNARATGLTRGQTKEYFEGITRALEDGLSKGFTKSATEVSKNIANVSLRSGNDKYWQGELGIDNYLQMSNNMASNTSLASSSNMLLFQAMKKANPEATWTETMQKIEAGDWGDETFLTNYRDILSKAYGSDKDSIMAALKESFGTNWQGASKMYETIFNPKTENEDGTKETVESVSNRYDVSMGVESEYLKQKNLESQAESNMASAGRINYSAKLDTITKLLEKGSRALKGLTDVLGTVTVKY